MINITDSEYFLLRGYLENNWGIEIPAAKRYLFETRLSGFLTENDLPNFTQLYHRLKKQDGSGALAKHVIRLMTTNETSFFRDPHLFEALSDVVLPHIAEKMASTIIPSARRIRIWSAGCSTGEEPYSIAITAREWQDSRHGTAPIDIEIHACDVSPHVLEHAKEGVYPAENVEKEVPEAIRDKYFEKSGNCYRIAGNIGEMVTFADICLAEPFEHLGEFDLIFCRNVIIYFAQKHKQKVLKQFHKLLSPGGVLILGSSESLYGQVDGFTGLRAGQAIYYTAD